MFHFIQSSLMSPKWTESDSTTLGTQRMIHCAIAHWYCLKCINKGVKSTTTTAGWKRHITVVLRKRQIARLRRFPCSGLHCSGSDLNTSYTPANVTFPHKVAMMPSRKGKQSFVPRSFDLRPGFNKKTWRKITEDESYPHQSVVRWHSSSDDTPHQQFLLSSNQKLCLCVSRTKF